MPVHHGGRQQRGQLVNALSHLGRREAFRLGVEDRDGEALLADERRHEAGPHGRLDRRQRLTERLIDLQSAARIDEE